MAPFFTCSNDLETSIAFFLGALASVGAGFSGMNAATAANGRTAMAAKADGQAGALAVSYNGGAVMGLSVGGLGLLGISLVAFWLGAGETDAEGSMNAISAAAGFGMGALSFARVGGGIYTEAADVGADLVGKVEAGIPEDDPATPVLSPTTWATTSATLLAWGGHLRVLRRFHHRRHGHRQRV